MRPSLNILSNNQIISILDESKRLMADVGMESVSYTHLTLPTILLV